MQDNPLLENEKDHLNKVENSIKKIITDLFKEKEPQEIYHYTNNSGLVGILEKKVLWLSDIKKLNDPSELEKKFSSSKEIIISLLKDHGLEKIHPALDWVSKLIDAINTSNDLQYFVCSLSKTGNELNLWRVYANNGIGYQLTFNYKDLKRRGFTVQYQAMANKISEMLLKELKLIFNEASTTLDQKISFQKELANKLISLVAYPLLTSKHEAYIQEEEYRIVQLYNKLEPKSEKEVKTRYRGYEKIEYTELNWEGALTSIMIGPAADQEKAERFVRDLLKEFNIEGVDVTRSKIPYRSMR